MKQVIQRLSGGPVEVIDVPAPTRAPTEVLVQTTASLISAGTELSAARLAQSSLVEKARARPDLVRKVVSQARSTGVVQTMRTVRSRLDEVIPMGYSAAGIAIEVGEAVNGVVPGQLVATGGAYKANHAEFQAVPGLLCSVVPLGVPAEDAAFATLASVAMHALRQADVGPGGNVVVVGLGLVGQLAARLAVASGLRVLGIDLAPRNVELAAASGVAAFVESGMDTTEAIRELTRGHGADAVIVTAASKSSQVMQRAPDLCRDRATLVVVGDVGLELDRRPFYARELTLRFARSYGPGRYDRSYEDWGVDYPLGYVRWTEGRNQDAVLQLLASGHLAVGDLITHRFDIASAPDAYELLDKDSEPHLGVLLTYESGGSRKEAQVPLHPPTRTDKLGIGLIGAGHFAREVLLPSFAAAGLDRFVAVTSSSGLSAQHLGERGGFEKAVAGADAVIHDDDVGIVVIATPHEQHAGLVVQALRAGKHVFCEKPLGLSTDDVEAVEEARRSSSGVLFVGYNRRWSSAVHSVRALVGRGVGPVVVTYRVNAGRIDPAHWYHDRRHGGRLLGEVCHFVDTCSAIIGHEPTEAHAFASGVGERVLDENVAVTLRYADGSLATITYGSGGHQSMEKERIDVVGRGHSGTIVDFRSVVLDGKRRTMRQDKGHAAEVEAFARAVSGESAPAPDFLSTDRASLAAVASLLQRS